MFIRILLTLLVVLSLAGCASVPEGRGRPEADALAGERGVPVPETTKTQPLVRELLSRALGPEHAVKIALMQNPRLRAGYARLGLSAADIYSAGRLSNPVLFGSRLDSDEPGALDQVTFRLSQSFADLLLLSDRSELARREFIRAQAEVAAQIFEVASHTSEAWYELAATMEKAGVLAASADAAQAGAELAQRFFEAGNMSRLELARLRAEAAEAKLEAVNAQMAVDNARAALGTLMGLDVATEWRIRKGLPAPPATAPDLARLKRTAADSRLDLLAARREVAALEHALGVTRKWRWLGELEVEAETERETDGSRLTGLGLALELPVFDQHRDDVVRAESRLESAYARRDALATLASHEIELATARLAASRTRLNALGDGVLPERRNQVNEVQKRVNFMLMGVFELIEARRVEYRAINDYLGAVRDYWSAHVALEKAVGRMITPPDNGTIDARGLMQIESDMAGMQHGGSSRGPDEPERSTENGERDPSHHHQHNHDHPRTEH